MKISLRGLLLIVLAIILGVVGIYLYSIGHLGYSILTISIFIVLFIMGIVVISNNITPEKSYESKIKDIINTYDSILVRSNNIPNLEGRNIIVLESIEDLVDAQLEIRKPICYLKQNESCSFVLFDEKEAYIYLEKLNEEVISPIEIELKNIKLKTKNDDQIDSSMIRNIDKTTIVKLSNQKSFKVSPIRESTEKIQVVEQKQANEENKVNELPNIPIVEEQIELLELEKTLKIEPVSP